MIFRKMLFISLVLFIGFSLQAQKVKFDPIKVSYTQLPSRPLDASFSTYSVHVVVSNHQLENLGMTRGQIVSNHFRFSGFKYLEKGGHFNIQARIGWFRLEGIDTKRKESKTKDKEGNEKVTVTYEKIITYSQPISYTVRDYQGNTITEGVISGRDNIQKVTFATGSTRSYVDGKWRDGRAKFLIEKEKSYVRSKLNDMGNVLRRLYDFRQYKDQRDNLEIIKKHSEESGMNKAYGTVVAAFAKMKADKPIGAIKGDVKSAIEYWEGITKKYDAGNKKERKLVHAALHNLATTYYWLDEFSLARTYAERCIKEVAWKEGRLKTIIRQIDGASELVKKNGLEDRHPFRDLSQAVSPAVEYEIAQAEEEAAQEAAIAEANTERFVGLRISNGGEQVMGEFSINQVDTKELLFGQGGNVKFMVNDGGEMKEQSLEPDQTTTFAFNDRQFTYIDFQPSHKIVKNEAAAMEIMEVLYEGKHISVYMFHPRTDKGRSELAIKKSSEEMPSSLKGAQFIIFKTGLSNYFSDCEMLSEKIKEGEFSNNQEDIIKAAKLYNSECVKP